MFYGRINVRHHNGALARENSVCLNVFQTKEFIIKFSAVQTHTSENLMMEWRSEVRVKKSKEHEATKRDSFLEISFVSTYLM